MSSKGQNPLSFRKHEWLEYLARGQLAMVKKSVVLRQTRIALIDMMAGDGAGVLTDAPHLPNLDMDDESRPTPAILVNCRDDLTAAGIAADLILCEIVGKRRAQLSAKFPAAIILDDCRRLLEIKRGQYDLALLINDPNGPSDANIEVAEHLSVAIPKADFLFVVNTITIKRERGLRAPGENAADIVKRAYLAGLRDEWQLQPLEWAKRLHRRHVLASRKVYGNRAMQGRIQLVTNFPQRTPTGFDHLIVASRMDRAQPAAPASGQPPLSAAG